MSRRTSSLIAAACLTLAALTSACGRSDATGPSDQPRLMHRVPGLQQRSRIRARTTKLARSSAYSRSPTATSSTTGESNVPPGWRTFWLAGLLASGPRAPPVPART